jgi:hypothetical protein
MFELERFSERQLEIATGTVPNILPVVFRESKQNRGARKKGPFVAVFAGTELRE